MANYFNHNFVVLSSAPCDWDETEEFFMKTRDADTAAKRARMSGKKASILTSAEYAKKNRLEAAESLKDCS